MRVHTTASSAKVPPAASLTASVSAGLASRLATATTAALGRRVSSPTPSRLESASNAAMPPASAIASCVRASRKARYARAVAAPFCVCSVPSETRPTSGATPPAATIASRFAT
eukprot:2591772-Prymnesium_polylepis.1